MKAYRECRPIASLRLKLCFRWRGIVSFMMWPPYNGAKSPPFFNLRGHWVGARVGLGVLGNSKLPFIAERPAHTVVTVVTEL